MKLLKKYLWLVIGVVASGVLLAPIGSRLFFMIRSYQKEKRELNAASSRLEQLYQRQIFPSTASIIGEKGKWADLVDEYNELNGWLSAGQVRPQEMEAAEFMPFLENTLRRIRDSLQTGRVTFPDKYEFGFEKYARGQLPMPKNIPRLVQQLKMTENICRLLPDSGVNELILFARDEFESVSDKAAEEVQTLRRRAPAPVAWASAASPDEELVSTQHFKIAFRAREGAALDFFNHLARLTMFNIITRIEINNPRQEMAFPGAGQARLADDKKSEPGARSHAERLASRPDELTREKRILLGREEVEVRVEFDVYNFGPPVDFREGRGTKIKEM